MAMQLVSMFQGSPDPYTAAANFVVSLGGGGGQFVPQQKKFRAAPKAGERGNWACTSCGNINFAFRDECNKCKASKPADA